MQDRFTGSDRITPPIDQEQNWFLIDGVEEGGNTTLRFWRYITSCDSSDLTITVSSCMYVVNLYHNLPVAYVRVVQLVLLEVTTTRIQKVNFSRGFHITHLDSPGVLTCSKAD